MFLTLFLKTAADSFCLPTLQNMSVQWNESMNGGVPLTQNDHCSSCLIWFSGFKTLKEKITRITGIFHNLSNHATVLIWRWSVSLIGGETGF